jgi:hypothetical protein
MTSCPKRRMRTPRRAISGSASIRPNTWRLAGSESKPSSRSGELRWKNDSACDCRIWPRFIIRRSVLAAGGGSTPRMASPALAPVSTCDTGQIPQVRAVRAGISYTERPRQNASKPRNSTTWKRVSCTRPASSSRRVIFA